MTVQRWAKTLPTARRTTVLDVQLPKLMQSTDMKRTSLQLGLAILSSMCGFEQVDLKSQFGFVNAQFARRLGIGIGELLGRVESESSGNIVPNKGIHFELMRVKCAD